MCMLYAIHRFFGDGVMYDEVYDDITKEPLLNIG